ncbi:crotonase/enoyl-CoA hydratase family protein [Antribacter gilvus]|uniref:crotonase/enoyl-CoA hydratase family protein n=1 Tax=Antribacter gilvus TaxID=2304675 RepID=UPI000F79223C|nr:crotonase/enoyl-CoA hydratase family protein [Antribacter gilvus]
MSVTCTVADGIADVRLDRPDKLNALSLAMVRELAATGHRLRRERGLRAVVLSGNGRAFCAGMDLGSAARDPFAVVRGFVPTLRGTNVFQEAVWAWRRLPVPVVAALHGPVFGAGLQLALGADLRVTAPDARWCVAEIGRGLVPDMSGVHALAQLVGIETAKRLTFTADEFSGEQAVALGVAGTLSDTPLDDARALAARIAEHRPAAVAAAKRLFDQTWSAGPRRTFRAERREQSLLLPGAMQNLKRSPR